MQRNSGSDGTEYDGAEPANLRLLRRLVTALMVVMILGLITLVGLIVIRFAKEPAPALPVAAAEGGGITLPDGRTAEAYTVGRGWYAVVTEDQHILIFDSATGDLLQDIPVRPEESGAD